MSKQKEERASHGWKISQVQITRLDFRGREGTNTEPIPHQNTGLAGDEKVTQQLDRNPTHFPEAVNLHIPCTHFVAVLPLWAIKNQHAAHHGRSWKAPGRCWCTPAPSAPPLLGTDYLCKVPRKPYIQSRWEHKPCPRLVKPGALSSTSSNKTGYFLWIYPPAQGKSMNKQKNDQKITPTQKQHKKTKKKKKKNRKKLK